MAIDSVGSVKVPGARGDNCRQPVLFFLLFVFCFVFCGVLLTTLEGDLRGPDTRRALSTTFFSRFFFSASAPLGVHVVEAVYKILDGSIIGKD